MSTLNILQETPVPLIIKMGGSLYEGVPDLVPVLKNSPRPLLIVPGGGRFADAVRDANLPDDEAHWMAIQAMDQFGEYLGSFGLPLTDHLRIPETVGVLLPYRCMRVHDPLPHSWDITSDTIAAWVADTLGLELLLLKSVDGICADGILMARVDTPLATDIVDPCCIPFILKHRIRATIINGSKADTVARFLDGKQVPRTEIGTTF